jgi:hypothetical protein
MFHVSYNIQAHLVLHGLENSVQVFGYLQSGSSCLFQSLERLFELTVLGNEAWDLTI